MVRQQLVIEQAGMGRFVALLSGHRCVDGIWYEVPLCSGIEPGSDNWIMLQTTIKKERALLSVFGLIG